MTIVNLSKITSFIKSFLSRSKKRQAYFVSLEKHYAEQATELYRLKRLIQNKKA